MSSLAGVWRRLPAATSLLIGILVGLLVANVRLTITIADQQP